MQFSNLDIIVVVGYLLGIGALGIYQAKKIKSSGDYFAGGRKFNKFMMIMHQLGTGTHADDPVGVVGASYQRGLSGIWYTYVFLFITPFYWIIAPFFRRSRYLTTSDFFEGRYGPSLGLLYSIMGILTFTINIGTMLKGTGQIVTAFSGDALPQWVPIVAMTLVFVAYGTSGGLIATVYTETVQGALIVVMSLLLVPFGLMKVGGFHGLHQLLTPDKFSLSTPHEMSLAWILAGALASLIGIVAQPHTMEVCASGKTEWEGRMGFTYGSFIKRFCALGWALTGVIVLGLAAQGTIGQLDNREHAFGTAIRTLLPSGFIGLMLAAILAAQMAALSAFMVAASALLTRNIYRRYFNHGVSDLGMVKFARFSGLGVVAMGAAFAFIVPGVADALTIFWGVTTFTGVLIWAGILWRRTTTAGAWASFLVMVVLWSAFGLPGSLLHRVLPGVAWLGMYADKTQIHWLMLTYLPAGLVALVVGSLLTRQSEAKKLDDFYTLIKTPVGREQELIDQGIKMVYRGESTGHPWELKHPRLVNILGFAAAMCFSLLCFGLLWLMGWVGA